MQAPEGREATPQASQERPGRTEPGADGERGGRPRKTPLRASYAVFAADVLAARRLAMAARVAFPYDL